MRFYLVFLMIVALVACKRGDGRLALPVARY